MDDERQFSGQYGPWQAFADELRGFTTAARAAYEQGVATAIITEMAIVFTRRAEGCFGGTIPPHRIMNRVEDALAAMYALPLATIPPETDLYGRAA